MFNQKLEIMKFTNQCFILFLIITLFLSIGCSKEKDELVLYEKKAGKLNIEVYQQDDETPVANKLVKLYSGSTEFKTEETDSKGKVDFGQLLQGNYTISLKDINLGTGNDLNEASVYNVNKIVQVMTDETTKEKINVKDYVGSFYVTVIDLYTDSVYTDANIYLLKKDIYERHDYSIDNESDIIPYAIDQKTTDDKGMATFTDVPANYNYMFFVANDADTADIETDNMWYYLDTKEEEQVVLDVSLPVGMP